jgi:hypothetical protein
MVENSTQTVDYMVVLVGNVLRKNGGDIAIDDVVFSYDCLTATKTTAGSTPTPTPPPTNLENCDFQDGLCGWNVDAELNATDTFIFQRSNGNAHTSGDGPTFDHNDDREKFFLWAQTNYGLPNIFTSISSPVVSPFKKVCFEFYFDMSHGTNIKDLQIAVEEQSQSKQTIVWQYTEPASFWEFARVEVEQLQDFKIILTAVQGSGQGVEYVAVDDFMFIIDSDGSCQTVPPAAVPTPPTAEPTQPTEPPHSQFTDCNFEKGMCGWNLDHSGQWMRWIRSDTENLINHGYDTPKEDHAGLYMYVAPLDGSSGDGATLETALGSEAQGCMQFYFSLWHEGGIRALKVRAQDPDGYVEYIWDLTDFSMESNQEWWVGTVNFNTHQLVFEATHAANTSRSGYAALDDITFDFGPEAAACTVLPPEAVVKPTTAPQTDQPTTTATSSTPHFCNFEEGFCGWNIDSGLNDTEAFVFKRTRGADQDGIHGPIYDHDTTDTNYFIWASAASGNPDTETALSSPQFSTSIGFCFSFWFDLTVSYSCMLTSIQVFFSALRWHPHS